MSPLSLSLLLVEDEVLKCISAVHYHYVLHYLLNESHTQEHKSVRPSLASQNGSDFTVRCRAIIKDKKKADTDNCLSVSMVTQCL